MPARLRRRLLCPAWTLATVGGCVHQDDLAGLGLTPQARREVDVVANGGEASPGVRADDAECHRAAGDADPNAQAGLSVDDALAVLCLRGALNRDTGLHGLLRGLAGSHSMPNTAMMASPATCSTMPPWLSMGSSISGRYWLSVRNTCSGCSVR